MTFYVIQVESKQTKKTYIRNIKITRDRVCVQYTNNIKKALIVTKETAEYYYLNQRFCENHSFISI